MAKDVIWLAMWLFMAWGGWQHGKSVGRPVLGAMLGFFLGLPGLAILWFIGRRWPRRPAQPEPTEPTEPTEPQPEPEPISPN
jgi:hypothetical protein